MSTATSEMPVALYRLYATDGTLLYVGITSTPAVRLSQHAKSKQWWPLVASKTISWHETRDQAAHAELSAIQTEHPVHNSRGSGPRTRQLTPSDRHRHNPIPFRPPRDDRSWLLGHAQRTGQAVNAILNAALAAYRERHEKEDSP